MAMLAERKQKVKWVINPTKKPLWKTDQGGMKFGLQLMEKMGWTPGKGLGIHEQGTPEPIRVGYKSDTKGMGFKEGDDDWIQNQDEFNSLLSSLANTKASNILVAGKDLTKNPVESLEEKSRRSKYRVHYQKFTRGKDISRYSENDLACILGSRKRKFKDEDYYEGKEGSDLLTFEDMENTFGVTTLNGGSMIDYFRRKRETMVRPPELHENKESFVFGAESVSGKPDSNPTEKCKSKKKKKKSKDSNKDLSADSSEGDQNKKKSKKNKKGSRYKERNASSVDDASRFDVGKTEQNREPERTREGSLEKDNDYLCLNSEKRNKNKKLTETNSEDNVGKIKRKKKKRRLEEGSGNEALDLDDRSASLEAIKKQEKKRKKEKKSDLEVEVEVAMANLESNVVEINITKENFGIFCFDSENKAENLAGCHENEPKAFKKPLGRNKIFDLICDAQVDKFKGSNLETLTGYGLVKSKR